ncbi:pre-mRNA-splicing factor ISY1 homolog isoform X2 [Bos indicus]|uniref:Pre-mRNA-splicing factor ISY1 homolog isoform X2 n=1 Tax=Bos indicus TaxID=9915 RepID=A0ABM4RC33_BOSIN
MPSSHLILCRPLLHLPPIPPSIRVFSNESTLHVRWPKDWSFSFSIIPSKEIPGLISFRMDWLDLLAVQGTLKSLLQHHSSKASVLQCSAFFTVQLSHPYMTTALPPPRKTRAELMKAIDFEYYGYLDEDDGVIVPLEQEYEKRHRAELVEKWKAEREARLARGEEEEGEEEEEVNIYAVAEEESDEEGGPDGGGEDGRQKFIAHVPVPSQQEIEEALVRRKKMELLQKYTSETLQAQSEEARRLLGC